MNWLFKDNYPIIALILVLLLLLLDVSNYQILIVFSNVLGFSFSTNYLIKEKYKGFNLYSVYGLSIINIINIIACFFTSEKQYENYFRILMISVLIITISIPFIKCLKKKQL